MTAFEATLVNQTGSVWTLAIYVTIPNASSMLSVAWQVSPAVAPNGSNGVTWTDTPCVCLGTSSMSGGVQIYKQNLYQNAAVNQGWTVTLSSNALVLNLTGSSLGPNEIDVTNSSGQVTNIALGYSQAAAVYAANVPSGAAAGFTPAPTWWALITQSVKQGQVVAFATPPTARLTTKQIAGQFIPPVALNFPTNQTAATLTLTSVGSSVTVTPTYSATS